MDTILKQRRSLTPLPRPPENFDGFAATRSEVFNWLVETLLIWQERAAERAHLASLDDRILKDIGISRSQADIEARKPFWRV